MVALWTRCSVLTRKILLRNEMRRAAHVAGVGKKKVVYRDLVDTPEINEIAWPKWETNIRRHPLYGISTLSKANAG
jgi:hypothetical protein